MRFSLLCYILLSLWICQNASASAGTDIFFSPDQSIQEALFNEIGSAQSTIDLAIHEITSRSLAQGLLKAKERGVKIRIIADSKQAKLKTSKITFLINEGISVKVLRGKDHGVMNYRFAIFDGKKVMTGSFNWSEASEKWNYENLILIREAEAVTSYQKEFERLWREKRVIR